MVGWAIRKGTAGRGGRRFQILAAVLTYWAVGLAYTPLAFKGGHIGIYVSGRAQREVPPAIHSWLAKRAD